MMKRREQQHLESNIEAQCGRRVSITQRRGDVLRIVLEPTGDRGRVELIAEGSRHDWTITDREMVHSVYGLDLDTVVERLADCDTAITRRGDELVAHTTDRSLIDAVASFVDNIEIIPVLTGLFANDRMAA
ncbi:MAG: hypothetical protein AB8G14_16400 [Ilumatobacter sp.]